MEIERKMEEGGKEGDVRYGEGLVGTWNGNTECDWLDMYALEYYCYSGRNANVEVEYTTVIAR